VRLGALVAAASAALALSATAFAAGLLVDPALLAVFDYPVSVPTVAVGIKITPQQFGGTKSGDAVRADIGFPDGFDAHAVDLSSIVICSDAASCALATSARPSDSKKVVATFDRSVVLGLLAGVSTPATVTLTVSGLIGTGALWSGGDMVTVSN
jgi:hypothetical protein